ncbi:Hypothetical protein SRAE_2000467000 [Strongyloides ratti]|uniref:G-protein coupled receptors family 1 profile domain-containing protein n=1 Tax=Strongyloides ratti TaxID=34506 RepID=A0A090LJY7_STRRB|nr:Hypothetical protein SRAE_2000467000 [Strongyloides ratti]CEF70028.1 Hypothetical protein SRAE_2000467000 [Strongyloides ratti]
MTMVMSLEYIFACSTHLIFNGYLLIYHYTNSKVHVPTCSKLSGFNMNIKHFPIVTPLYFSIFRFYKILLNRNPHIIIIIIVMLITLGPIFYIMIGQFFEIKVYYLPKDGCGYEIFSGLPFYEKIVYLNLFLIFFVPFLSLLINYTIYRNVVKKTIKSNNVKLTENKALFYGIAIQSIFPFLCQIPAILFIFYFAAS